VMNLYWELMFHLTKDCDYSVNTHKMEQLLGW
jgi:hypothetical protein